MGFTRDNSTEKAIRSKFGNEAVLSFKEFSKHEKQRYRVHLRETKHPIPPVLYKDRYLVKEYIASLASENLLPLYAVQYAYIAIHYRLAAALNKIRIFYTACNLEDTFVLSDELREEDVILIVSRELYYHSLNTNAYRLGFISLLFSELNNKLFCNFVEYLEDINGVSELDCRFTLNYIEGLVVNYAEQLYLDMIAMGVVNGEGVGREGDDE